MRGRRVQILRGLACAALLSAAAPAQQLTLDLHLAPSGPRESAGWQQLRRSILPRLEGWPRDLPATDALVLRIRWPWQLEAALGSAPRDAEGRHLHFRASLRIEGVGELHGQRRPDGRETWRGTDLQPARGRLLYLCRMAGLDRLGASARSLQPCLLHLSGPGRALPRLLWDLLQLSARIETLRARVAMEGQHLLVRAPRGSDGLLLPAVLMLAADLHQRPTPRELNKGPEGSRSDVLLMAALAGTDLQQQVAILALGSVPDPRVPAALRALLGSQDETRNAAMQALAMRLGPSAAPLIEAAGSNRVRFSQLDAAQSLRLARGRGPTRPHLDPASQLVLHAALPTPGLGFGPYRPGLRLPLPVLAGDHPGHGKGVAFDLTMMGLLVGAGLTLLWYTWYHLRT